MLTGKIRYRCISHWFRTKLVLQVQEEITISDPWGFADNTVLVWRDATFQDLTEE